MGRIGKMESFDRLDPSRFHWETVRKQGEDVLQYQLMARITFFVRHVEEICQLLREINDHIRINDQSGEDLIVRFTDFDAIRKGLLEFVQN